MISCVCPTKFVGSTHKNRSNDLIIKDIIRLVWEGIWWCYCCWFVFFTSISLFQYSTVVLLPFANRLRELVITNTNKSRLNGRNIERSIVSNSFATTNMSYCCHIGLNEAKAVRVDSNRKPRSRISDHYNWYCVLSVNH